jgi:hypothetical protein
MNDIHQENEVTAGPQIFAIPAYGFAMALYLDWLGRSPTRQAFPPTLRGTHIPILLPGQLGSFTDLSRTLRH